MAHHFYKLKERIKYRFKIRHHNGHGIHSPFLYRFVTSLLQEKHPYYCFERIEALRKELYPNRTSGQKKEKYCGQILFRIVKDSHFKTLLELGTLTGMETQYMALANPNARCVSITRSEEWAKQAQIGFQKQGLSQIEFHSLRPEHSTETIINQLNELDLILFNQRFTPQEILNIFGLCLQKRSAKSIFVFTDIHKNPERNKAWKTLRTHAEVRVSIDMYNLGILLFNPELEKKKYVLRSK